MTPGRLSPRSELPPVPSYGSILVYMIPPQISYWPESPRREFTPVLVPGREFHSGTKSRNGIMQVENDHRSKFSNLSNKLTSLPMCGFIAQLVEQRTSNAEVTGSNPVEALIFFFRLLLSNCLNWKIYCDDHSPLSSTTAVQ